MTDPTNIYQTVPVRQVAPRSPLAPRQKSGARLAGIVSFLMLSLGFGMLWIPLSLLAIAGVFAVAIGLIDRANRGSDMGFDQFTEFVSILNPTAWIIPLVLVAVIGAALMVAGLVISARILRSHGVAKAWPVTWAAAGIAVIASWIVSGVLSVPLQIVGMGFGGDRMQSVPLGIVVGVIGFLVGIAATAAIGWLSWWWMAHVMRAPVDISADNDDAASTANA